MTDHSISAYDTLYSRYNMRKAPYGYPRAYVYWRSGQLRKPWMEYILPGETVLDIGGGYGVTARWLPKGTHFINLDCSSQMLKWSPGYPVLAASESMPFPDNSQTSIICSETLEHVASPEQTLAECWRVLCPGGYLFLSTPRKGWQKDWASNPLFRNLSRFYRKPIKNFQPDPPGVVSTSFNESQLRAMLEKQHFTVLRQYRADTHVPWMSTNLFWRLFSTLFVDPQKYGHCAVFICRKGKA